MRLHVKKEVQDIQKEVHTNIKKEVHNDLILTLIHRYLNKLGPVGKCCTMYTTALEEGKVK